MGGVHDSKGVNVPQGICTGQVVAAACQVGQVGCAAIPGIRRGW